MARQKKPATPSTLVSPSIASDRDDVSIPEDLFSDESDFHGSSETKALYTQLAASFDVEKYWAIHDWNAQVIAVKGRKALAKAAKLRLAEKARKVSEAAAAALKKHDIDDDDRDHDHDDNDAAKKQKSTIIDEDSDTATDTDTEMQDVATKTSASHPAEDQQLRPKPQNYYEGHPSAKQLDESVSDFLARLPPSTTTAARAQDHWIWICNPFPSTTRSRSHPGMSPSEDLATFKQRGTRLLEAFLARKTELEATRPAKPPGVITRMLRPDRMALESSIRELARSHGVVSGKWMLFRPDEQVDEVWQTIAHALWGGKLGSSAKVATATATASPETSGGGGDENGSQAGHAAPRLICIYTADFTDEEDVRRVLCAIKDLGLLGPSEAEGSASATSLRTIYYKTDAYTYLDISGGNEYKLKASMYSSRDLFPEWYPGGGRGGRR
ncbi:hypothetical protein A1O7_03837 [Cladophialophora yegresii CBS 114405]|uniref:DUF1917 domain-containing protein n=1 Tax=Cladophialophora yegresii CBS 114405 TaxID=1182544 RepID=W9W577_9EURO|nr:uncharacterized protein A1O7_03837 [Cladophialophora yegresii CBS 114405]EXJ59691.1 hypothetical protein A1O7_03837 [Cladophialophora yegresii CBS 114405]